MLTTRAKKQMPSIAIHVCNGVQSPVLQTFPTRSFLEFIQLEKHFIGRNALLTVS